MRAELERVLAQREKKYIEDASRVPSAVLIPIYQRQGQYYIVFIKRTDLVKDHKGQIAFPGGARDITDATLQQTAIRESYEEIGLRAQDIDIIGEMDDEVTTTSNYILTPFVAMIPYPYRFRNNRDEVAAVIRVPLAALLDENRRQASSENLVDETSIPTI